MAPVSSIETWPPEVMESVATYLRLSDLCNFRLVSQKLGILVAQDTFKQYFRTKHVDVSPESLADFAHITKPGLMGGQVENLVLCGLAFSDEHLERIVGEKARWVTEGNGPMFCSTQHKLSDVEFAEAKEGLDALRKRKMELEEFHQVGTDADLLAEAFGNIAEYGKHGKLLSLTLEVAVLQEGKTSRQRPIQTRSRTTVWGAAEASFRATMAGLAQSGMPVQKLDVLTGQWHCSLSWSALCCIEGLRGSGLERSLGGLQSLSLSLSADGKAVKEDDDDGQTSEERGDNDHRALADLLTLCPRLVHLHLHWFMLRGTKYDDPTGQELLHHAMQADTLGSLSDLALRGLRFQESTILELLQKAPVQDLRLENIHITDPRPATNPAEDYDEEDEERQGQATESPAHPIWDAIFAHCSSIEANMFSIFFDDLWGKRLLHFKGTPNRSRMPWIPYTDGCETLERKGENVRDKIEYTYPRGRPLGSPQAYKWRVGREREYGPA